MNATNLLTAILFTAIAGAAFAAQQPEAEVARDGILIRYGEATGHYAVPPSSQPSTMTRAKVMAAVTRAREDGTLRPAGEAPPETALAPFEAPSKLARADVKERVLDAREEGKLRWNGNAYGYERREFRGRLFGTAAMNR
jgi:hypothetical protein